MQDEQRVPKFVGDIHAPIVARLQSAVETLQDLASHYGRFFPCGVLIGQLFAFPINLDDVVMNIEKISRHVEATQKEMR